MNEAIKQKISKLEPEIADLSSYLKIGEVSALLLDVNAKVEGGNYAKDLLQEKSRLERTLKIFQDSKTEFASLCELAQLAFETDDFDTQKEVSKDFDLLIKKVTIAKTEAMFDGKDDLSNAILEINPGAGGTESQDWAEMLERIYLRFAEHSGFKAEVLHRISGEEAGIKQSIIRISGDYAFGWLKYETGIHRLVRISPFNAQGKRQTSFCGILVIPEVLDDTKIIINPSDLKIDTYRSSGAGGQHVNTTDSAIRITHIPTGIVVTCQNDRSQHKNKSEAMKILTSRLYELEERKKQEAKDSVPKDDVSWGNQIKNYVLQPYKLVKDTRTGFESFNIEKIMDGEISDLLLSTILHFKNNGNIN